MHWTAILYDFITQKTYSVFLFPAIDRVKKHIQSWTGKEKQILPNGWIRGNNDSSRLKKTSGPANAKAV